jgi:hypothetical protein
MTGETTENRQINIRVSTHAYRVLKAAAIFDGYGGMQRLLVPVVEEKARELELKPRVRDLAAELPLERGQSARRRSPGS